MLTIFFATYAAVFLAEIVGDKLLYTSGILATRYRSLPIMLGVTLAFMIKMGVAVLLGDAIAQLPKPLVAALTSLSFVGMAVVLWRKSDAAPASASNDSRSQLTAKPAMVSFVAILLSEWADVGQIAAATMAARYPQALIVVWFASVSAMATKGVLAAFLGAGVRKWIATRVQPKWVRYASVAAILIVGAAAVGETMGWIDED